MHIPPQSGPKVKDSSGLKKWVIGCFVVVPLLCCAGGAFYSRRWIDSFDNSADLEHQVAEARKQGLPMESSELVGDTIVADADNSYPEIKKFMKEFPNVDMVSKSMRDFKVSKGIKFPDAIQHFISRSKQIAKYKKFEAHRDYDLGVNLLFPEYSYIKEIARGLALQAQLDAANGNTKSSIENLHQVSNLIAQLSNEKVIIGALVQIAIKQIYFRAIAKAINWLEADNQAIASFEVLLKEDLSEPNFKMLFRGEFFFGVNFARNFDAFGGLKGLGGEHNKAIDSDQIKRSGLPKSHLHRGMLDSYIQTMLKLNAIFNAEPNKAFACRKADKVIAEIPITVSSSMTHVLTPEWTRFGEVWEYQKLSKAMLLECISVLRKRENNQFPGEIREIPDPVAGGTLNYHRTGGGFMIYSSGPNKKDDGGPKNKTDRTKSDDFGFEYPFIGK